MASIPNTEEWKIFLQKFKDLPILWKIKSDEYKNIHKKNLAWEELLVKFKEVEADANIHSLKSKICKIRSCYRRERKKVQSSMKSGATEENVYEPVLWYYYYLDFLKDQEQEPTDNSNSIDLDTSENFQNSMISAKRKHSTNSPDVQFSKQTCSKLERTVNKPQHIEDEAEVFAKSWAFQYRKLTEEQQLYAKKAIDDILILGQLNQLTLNTISQYAAEFYGNVPMKYEP